MADANLLVDGTPPPKRTLSVWHIRYNHLLERLEPNFLNSFDVYGPDIFRALSLYGDLCLRANRDKDVFELLDWSKSTNLVHVKCSIRPPERFDPVSAFFFLCLGGGGRP